MPTEQPLGKKSEITQERKKIEPMLPGGAYTPTYYKGGDGSYYDYATGLKFQNLQEYMEVIQQNLIPHLETLIKGQNHKNYPQGGKGTKPGSSKDDTAKN